MPARWGPSHSCALATPLPAHCLPVARIGPVLVGGIAFAAATTVTCDKFVNI